MSTHILDCPLPGLQSLPGSPGTSGVYQSGTHSHMHVMPAAYHQQKQDCLRGLGRRRKAGSLCEALCLRGPHAKWHGDLAHWVTVPLTEFWPVHHNRGAGPLNQS